MAWYDVRLTLAGGGSIKIESSFRDLEEAEALVLDLMQRIGPVTLEMQTDVQSVTLSDSCIIAVMVTEQEEAGEY